MNKFSALAAAALMFSSIGAAQALVIDFDSVTTNFWIDSVQDSGFDVDRTDDGLGTLAGGYQESYWKGNGTGRLLSWTNIGNESGFTLEDQAGSSFSLNSFDFASGYVDGRSPVNSVTITGTTVGGTTLSETVAGSGDWATVSFSSLWQNLASVEFTALGGNNRTVWDNIVIDDVFANVSEPGTAALALLGVFGLFASRRQSKKA